MPIEFQCTQCGQLLRTPDGTAGKQAKCPQCGQIVEIPADLPPPEAAAASGASQEPVSEWEVAANSENPYAAPVTVSHPAYGVPGLDQRDGPPWERDGASLTSFWETCKLVLASPTIMFSTMRLSGGPSGPLTFAIVGGYIGTLATMIYQFAFAAMRAPGAMRPVEGVAGMACVLAVLVIVVPVGVVLSMYIYSGVAHLMLMLLSGNRHGFETTLRVACYCNGATYMLLLIPICGQFIQLVATVVYFILGVASAHEISIGKAVAAVLLPALLCFGVWITAIGAAIFLAMQQGGQF